MASPRLRRTDTELKGREQVQKDHAGVSPAVLDTPPICIYEMFSGRATSQPHPEGENVDASM